MKQGESLFHFYSRLLVLYRRYVDLTGSPLVPDDFVRHYMKQISYLRTTHKELYGWYLEEKSRNSYNPQELIQSFRNKIGRIVTVSNATQQPRFPATSGQRNPRASAPLFQATEKSSAEESDEDEDSPADESSFKPMSKRSRAEAEHKKERELNRTVKTRERETITSENPDPERMKELVKEVLESLPQASAGKLASLTAGGSGQGAQNTSQLMLSSSPIVSSHYMPYPPYSSSVFMPISGQAPYGQQIPYGQQTQVPFNQNPWRRPRQMPPKPQRCSICLLENPASDHYQTCELKKKGQKRCFICRQVVPFHPNRTTAFVEHLKKCRPRSPCRMCNEWHHASICDKAPCRRCRKMGHIVWNCPLRLTRTVHFDNKSTSQSDAQTQSLGQPILKKQPVEIPRGGVSDNDKGLVLQEDSSAIDKLAQVFNPSRGMSYFQEP